MSVLNSNIDLFKCFVRASHFTHDPADAEEFHPAYAFAVQSVAGKILTFHVMTDYGMLRSRVPISEVFWKRPDGDIPFHWKQLWDCFSENVSVIEYDYLAEKRCEVILRDGSKVWATYLMTVDWFRNPYSDEPSDYKCGHLLLADPGYLMCQPNNRILWRDSNWITRPFPFDKSRIQVDRELPSVEALSDRWVAEDGHSYYYTMLPREDGPGE
jgi:hypothetical protein